MKRLTGYSAGMLRDELSQRALAIVRRDGLLHELSYGAKPSILLGRNESGRHGNFHDRSFISIELRSEWKVRLAKVHTAWKRERARANWRWMELDSVNSSDALLMNIFCHPEVTETSHVQNGIAGLLGVDGAIYPRFGVRPGVPLKNGRADQTEIDMQIGNLFVEAKLTESDFQQANLKKLERYLDLHTVFDVSRLSWTRNGVVGGYQLIRNVLAAHASDCSFCVMLDSRRVDLVETWYCVMSAVQLPSFSWRLKLLTWQELARELPGDLQYFLEEKYGIRTASLGETALR